MKIPWWMMVIDPNDWKELGTVIKDFFSDLPMTQADLATKLRVDQTAISRWASGKTKPTLDEFKRAVQAVNERITELTERVTKSNGLVSAMEAANAAAGAGGVQGIQEGSIARSQVHEALDRFSTRKSGKRKRTKRKTKSRT